MKISHSAVSEYLECSQKYYLNRIEKLRSIKVNSSLIWGGAIDEGLNELLKTKMDPPELFPTPYKAYMTKWEKSEINGIVHDLKFCELIEYSKKDLDLNLFTQSEYDQIREVYSDCGDPALFAIHIENLRAAHPWWSYSKMEPDDKKAYNFLCWLSLARKAQYIFEAYKNEVLPLIKRVIAIQKEIALVNDDQDTVTGFIDLQTEMMDGSIRILDNKTTSDFKYYKEDSVRISGQLSLYCFSENVGKAGYIAILKDIKADGRKKGSLPTVKIKIRLDDIDPTFQEQTLQKFNITNKNIKLGVFEKLKDESLCVAYGRKCPYSDFCWRNSIAGLIKKV